MSALIYLDVDDEITSAVARIRAAVPGPVVVVVPYGSRLASSRINFRLLAREAGALRRDLVVVAPDAATRSLAASAGLPTHATVLEYEAAARAAGGAANDPAADPSPSAGAGPAPGPSPGVAPAAAPGPPDGIPGSTPAPGGTGAGVRTGGPARGWSQRSADEIVTVAPAAGPPASGPPPSGTPSAVAPSPPVVIVPPGDPRQYPRALVTAPSIPAIGPARRGPFTRTRIAVILVVLALLTSMAGVAGLVLLPSAEITLTPITEAAGPLTVTVTADPNVSTPDPGRLLIPASRLSLPVSVTGQFSASGKEVIEQKATGAVTFQNCDTGGAHTFPAGTAVRTPDGIAFLTNAAVRLDRAKLNPAFACTAANVNVTAANAGPEANVVAGTITRLPAGYDPVVLSVINRAATSGGSRTELLRIIQADVDAAISQLRAGLNEAFVAKLAEPATTPAASILVSQSQRLGEATPSTDPAALVGKEQASFELGLSATGTVLAVNPDPAGAVAEARLEAALPAGYRLVSGSIRTTVDPPAPSGEVATIAVRVRAERTREIDERALLAQIRGKSIAAARTVLELYGQVRITVWPDWVTAIPDSDSRVRLVVAAASAPGGGAGPSPGASAGESVQP